MPTVEAIKERLEKRINSIQESRTNKRIDHPAFYSQQWARQEELTTLLKWIEKQIEEEEKQKKQTT